MIKKTMTLFLSLIILAFSSWSIYAEDYMTGQFFYRTVVVNGNDITNYNLENPIFTYQNNTYIPLSKGMGQVLGFDFKIDLAENSLELIKIEPTQNNIKNNWVKNEGENLKLKVVPNFEVTVKDETAEPTEIELIEQNSFTIEDTIVGNLEEVLEEQEAYLKSKEDEEKGKNTEDKEQQKNLKIKEPIVETIDLGNLPILAKNEYFYLPIKVFKDSEIFHWSVYYESDFGVCIGTLGEDAKSYYRESEARYNKGLRDYILKYNTVLTKTAAEKLVFQFKRAGEINNLDEKLLMAVAHRESTFNVGAISRGGARGIMQLMPRTGANFGLTQKEMLKGRLSINAGASMVRAGLNKFNGNREKALSSYNQGSYRVAKGNYSRRYANRVTKTYNNLNSFLKVNGYIK